MGAAFRARAFATMCGTVVVVSEGFLCAEGVLSPLMVIV